MVDDDDAGFGVVEQGDCMAEFGLGFIDGGDDVIVLFLRSLCLLQLFGGKIVGGGFVLVTLFAQ